MKISKETLNLLLDCHAHVNLTLQIPELKYTRDNPENYQTLAPLARGGFGDVFIVQNKVTKQIYALKRLSKDKIKKSPHTALFQSERNCMIDNRSSKWLIFIHSAFQTPHYIFFLMDFYPGGDLLALLAKYDVLSEESIKFYAGELILALKELHGLGYIHRDIKPDNILVTTTGHIKLGDFGSCIKTIDGKVRSDVSVGTPDYISPEVLSSLTTMAEYSYEVDIWAFGVVVYEMLNGGTPFLSNSLSHTYKKISAYEYQNENGSKEIRDIIESTVCRKENRKNLDELMNMDFFKNMDWDDLKVPFLPDKDWNINFGEFGFKDDEMLEGKGTFEGFIGFTYDNSVRLVDDEPLENINKKNKNKDVLNKKNVDEEKITNRNDKIDDSDYNSEDVSNIEPLKEKAKKYNEIHNNSTRSISNIIKSLEEIAIIEPHNKNVTDENNNMENIGKEKSEQDKILKENSIQLNLFKKQKLNIDKNKIKIKESLYKIQMYTDNVKSQQEVVSYYIDHLVMQNNYLKKEIRKKESKIDYENAKFMDDLKKELRQKRMEIRELEHKIEDEILIRQKMTDEIKYLKSQLSEKKKSLAIQKEFLCKRIFVLNENNNINELIKDENLNKENGRKKSIIKFETHENKKELSRERGRKKSLVTYKECKIKINNEDFFIDEMKENISNVFIEELKENEIYFIGEKKRYLVIKVVFMLDKEVTISSLTRNVDELIAELKKEENILKGIELIIKRVNGKVLEDAKKQREGSYKRIEQLNKEIDRQSCSRTNSNINLNNDCNDCNNNLYCMSHTCINNNMAGDLVNNAINKAFVPSSYKEFNNHRFVNKTFKEQVLCYHCNQILYGTVEQGYECIDCKMITHKSCYVLVNESCELHKAVINGRVFYLMMKNVEEKEKFLKILKMA